MSVKEGWGKALIYGIYDAFVIVVNILLHPSISELIVKIPKEKPKLINKKEKSK